MRKQTSFFSSLIICAVLALALVLTAFPVMATDSSSGDYDDDNDCSKGYSCGNPQDSWRGLEMIYYKEKGKTILRHRKSPPLQAMTAF